MYKFILISSLLVCVSFPLWSKAPRSMLFSITTKGDKAEYFLFMDDKNKTLKEIDNYLEKISKQIVEKYGTSSATVLIRKGKKEVTASELLLLLDVLAQHFEIIKIYDESKGEKSGRQFKSFYIKSRRVSSDKDESVREEIEIPDIKGVKITPIPEKPSESDKEKTTHEQEHSKEK